MTPITPIDFYSFSREELGAWLTSEFDVPSYRATQLFQWVYKKGVTEPALWTDLGAKLREQLQERLVFPDNEQKEKQLSNDGSRKYLFTVDGGDAIESVMIKQPKRMTLCVSSQVGCGMGCSFCRTATMGFKRHLTTSEIIRQVKAVRDDAVNFGDSFSNIVFMGMGEPFHNFDNMKRAVSILTDPQGWGMAPRRITVSTSGLVPEIRRFGTEVRANIAISLNATTDEVRSEVMPINKKYPLSELLAALRDYPITGRKRITIEYVMLSGINDTDEDLKRLPKLLRNIPAKINLIPYNENAALGYKTPSRQHIDRWSAELHRRGMEVTVRWSKGQDIDAACGQLATESKRKAVVRGSLAQVAC